MLGLIRMDGTYPIRIWHHEDGCNISDHHPICQGHRSFSKCKIYKIDDPGRSPKNRRMLIRSFPESLPAFFRFLRSTRFQIVPVCPQGRHLRERPPRIRFCPVGVQAWDRQKRAQVRCARAKSSWSAVVAQRRWRLVGKQGRRAADAIGEDTELRVVHAGLADGRMRRVHADARRLLAPRLP